MNRAKWDRPGFRETWSERMKALWADPEWREATVARMQETSGRLPQESKDARDQARLASVRSPEQRAAKSELMKRNRQEPEFNMRARVALQARKGEKRGPQSAEVRAKHSVAASAAKERKRREDPEGYRLWGERISATKRGKARGSDDFQPFSVLPDELSA